MEIFWHGHVEESVKEEFSCTIFMCLFFLILKKEIICIYLKRLLFYQENVSLEHATGINLML